ncbi:hypothetical protein N658DRAFT_526545, partial [Parathielavia hyrcaniae]
MSTLHYTYRALQPNHIRLLHLDVGASDELHCKISHESLDSLPSYEALSYRWADSNMTEITVDEEGQQQRLPVTVSLLSALRNLRRHVREKTIWADALCIDQDDTSEKSVQIMLMGEVYRKARRVVTYIGDGDAYAQSAIAMAKKMMEWARPRAPTSSLSDKSKQQYLELCTHLGIENNEWTVDPHPNPIVQSIQMMLDASWSKRVWILQESLLNDSMIMMCGPHEMPWTMLDELGGLLSQRKLPRILNFSGLGREDKDKDAGSARTIRRMAWLRRDFKSMALIDIINATHHLLCFDPRDKIYGLYGVLNARNEAQQCARMEMEVSYQKSVADSL